MVFIIGGYPIPYSDAKVWALRHWPDINIYDELKLPVIISRYHKSRGGNVGCIGVNLEDGPGLVCFFVIYSKHDPQSTPLKYRQFPEGKLASRCKELLFSHEDDKELAEKVQFMTVADPYQDYYKVSLGIDGMGDQLDSYTVPRQFRPLPEELKRKRTAENQEDSAKPRS